MGCTMTLIKLPPRNWGMHFLSNVSGNAEKHIVIGMRIIVVVVVVEVFGFLVVLERSSPFQTVVVVLVVVVLVVVVLVVVVLVVVVLVVVVLVVVVVVPQSLQTITGSTSLMVPSAKGFVSSS